MAKKLYTTDVGTAIHPHLTQPDVKFPPPSFHVKLNTQANEKAEALIASIDALAAAALTAAKTERAGKKTEKGQKAPKLTLCDDMPYRREEDGTVTFSFKMKETGKRKDGSEFKMKPAIFDSKGVPITESINIGGGTSMKVSYDLDGFYTPLLGAGATLRLYGVQIIKLVEFTQRSADSFGFEVEDGFETVGQASFPTDEAATDDSDFTVAPPPAAAANGASSDEF